MMKIVIFDRNQGVGEPQRYDPAMNDAAIENLIRKYDRPVPRYTSYPTAVQFTQTPSWEADKALIHRLDPSEPVSIYIHIPFCHSLCHYCGCHTRIVGRYGPVSEYIATLTQEIALFSSTAKKRHSASRIHFGGGSPNLASTEDLEKIMLALGRAFHIPPEAQIDMECDPRLLSEEKIRALALMGIRRVSLGVQDFDPNVQGAINRIQPFEQVKNCVDNLRRHGIENINFDLITGLPLQTLETVEATLEKTLSLSPDRIAVFAYAHVPWMKKHQHLLEKFPRPDALTRYKMSELVREMLCHNGFTDIGIDHYAQNTDSLALAQQAGQLRRNFQGYTDDTATTLIGFGLSSISQYADAYTQNTTDAPAYRKAIAEGRIPSARSCYLTEQDQSRRALIERIMCDFEADLSNYRGIETPLESLTELLQDGLITLSHRKRIIRITEKGRPFVRLVAACFDQYLNQAELRHARAV